MNAVPDVSIHFSFVDKVDDVDKDFDAVWSTVDLLSVIEKVEEKCGFGGRIGENQTKIYHLRIQVGSEFWAFAFAREGCTECIGKSDC